MSVFACMGIFTQMSIFAHMNIFAHMDIFAHLNIFTHKNLFAHTSMRQRWEERKPSLHNFTVQCPTVQTHGVQLAFLQKVNLINAIWERFLKLTFFLLILSYTLAWKDQVWTKSFFLILRKLWPRLLVDFLSVITKVVLNDELGTIPGIDGRGMNCPVSGEMLEQVFLLRLSCFLVFWLRCRRGSENLALVVRGNGAVVWRGCDSFDGSLVGGWMGCGPGSRRTPCWSSPASPCSFPSPCCCKRMCCCSSPPLYLQHLYSAPCPPHSPRSFLDTWNFPFGLPSSAPQPSPFFPHPFPPFSAPPPSPWPAAEAAWSPPPCTPHQPPARGFSNLNRENIFMNDSKTLTELCLQCVCWRCWMQRRRSSRCHWRDLTGFCLRGHWGGSWNWYWGGRGHWHWGGRCHWEGRGNWQRVS